MKGIYKLLAGLLFICAIYGYFIIQQSTEGGQEKYFPIVVAGFGAFACALLSMGPTSKLEPSYRKWRFWKMLLFILLCAAFGAYYYLYIHKP